MSAAAHSSPVSCKAAYVIRRPPTISSAIVSGVASAHRATALGSRFSRASTGRIQAKARSVAPMQLDLGEDQRAIDEVFAAFFRRESPIAVVRAAEPLGFDAALWA